MKNNQVCLLKEGKKKEAK